MLQLFTKIYKHDKTAEVYSTPPEIREAITEWDQGKNWKLKPGTYTFGVVQANRRTPQQKIKTRNADIARRANGGNKAGKPKTIVPQRHLFKARP